MVGEEPELVLLLFIPLHSAAIEWSIANGGVSGARSSPSHQPTFTPLSTCSKAR